MKKKHHYVPRFYLSGFAQPDKPGQIWSYDKIGSKPVSVSVFDAATRNYYYAFTKEDGSRDTDSLEELLGIIEGKASSVIDKISNKETLTDNEKGDFAFFIAIQLTRVPTFRKWLSDSKASIRKRTMQISASYSETFYAIISKITEKERITINPEEFRNFCLKGDYDLEFSLEDSLKDFLQIAMYLVEIILNMGWGYIHTPSNAYFLTSDNPISCVDPYKNSNSPIGYGLADISIELTFPLSKGICFLASWQNNVLGHFTYPNEKYIWELNRRTIISATNYIFSPYNHDKIAEIIQNPIIHR
jgi:hypothetical protein